MKRQAKYHKKMALHVFHSFKEMNEHDVKQMAKSTPQQRFANITYILQQRYGKELMKPIKKFKLIKGTPVSAKRKKSVQK